MMFKKLNEMIESERNSLKHREKILNDKIKEFKSYVAKAERWEIAVFAESKIKDIERLECAIKESSERLGMLESLLNEEN